ncbi:MAG: hypothetical protein A2583_11550 [Bdellovibrionales bacterium RIFOXYD1_FULL_53_11]|nr:MAG: hypothetical protein A2583_11550 [Bdellovibrionales bacterium RIFOXYD1_FULL_53_11]
MLNVVKFQKDSVLLVRLSGIIQEGVDFNALIGQIPGSELIISCKEVQRINSSGVKLWIQYFQKLAATGKKLRLVECSPAIVEQINLIVNFACGAKVESVYLPFACGSCKAQFVSLFNTDDLKKVLDSLPEPACPKCKNKTMFDDIPGEYFEFLNR